MEATSKTIDEVLEKITFPCEVCLKDRPDKKLATVYGERKGVMYCNDNVDCLVEALKLRNL